MDFWKTIGVLLRRWYVSVPVFVVSLALGGGVFFKTPTQYEATGTMVLTAPTAGASVAIDPSKATGPGNPLLDFEGSLTITTQLLIQSLSSPAVQQQIATEGGSGTFTAGDGNTGGPFVVILADAKSPALAELTVNLALKYAQNELDARQKNLNAPPTTFIGTQSVVSPTTATTKISGKLKAGGIALVGGLVLSLLVAYGIESFSTRRRKRAAEEPDDDDLIADDDSTVDELDESAVPTKKMQPAPAPRPAPQPVRSAPPRPSPHPVSSHREREPRTQQLAPAKPRPTPSPVPNKNGAQNNSAPNKNPAANNGGANNGGASNGAPSKNGAANGKAAASNGNGNGNSHDWPRAEFRSPDSSTG